MTSSASRLINRFRRFWQRTDGGVLAHTALMLPILLASSGLAVDAGIWYLTKRSAQAAADAAALAMAHESVRSGDSSGMLQSATEAAAENGFEASNGDTIAFNSPPTSGDFSGSTSEIEVIGSVQNLSHILL